jgi:uncharacterized membrane protein YagU involved in acid resistance
VDEINRARIVVAGMAGALAMSVASYMFNVLRIPMVDFGRLIATKILRYHSHGTRLGLVLHIVNGVLLALIYALIDALIGAQLLPGFPWVRGLTYGTLLWLFMMVVVLPLLGDGLFGWRTSRTMVLSALTVHLLYGLILGLALGG